MDRAEERAGPEDVGDQALMRGLDTALPFVRPGLSLSGIGRRSCDRPRSKLGSSPCRGPALASARLMFDDAPLLLGCCYVGGRRGCGPVEPSIARAVHDPGLLVRRRMRSHDLAIDRPDEGRQLAGNRRGDDGRPLALAGERPKTPAQPHLRFPGNLAHRPRCGRHLYLLLAANTWRMPIAPSGFDQDTPRPTIAGLGDAAAVDCIACGAFGGYETEIPHQLAGVLKARQIADLGQHRHCRNEIYPAHRLQGCDDLGKGPLGHRVTDRLLQTLDTLALLAPPPQALRAQYAARDAQA